MAFNSAKQLFLGTSLAFTSCLGMLWKMEDPKLNFFKNVGCLMTLGSSQFVILNGLVQKKKEEEIEEQKRTLNNQLKIQ